MSQYHPRSTRRQFLTAVGAASTVGLTGCLSPSKPEQVNPKQFRWPKVNALTGWEESREIRKPQTLAAGTIGIYTAGSVYTNTRLKQSIKLLPQSIDQPLAAYFAAQIHLFENSFPGGLALGFISSERIQSQANAEIKSLLKNQFDLDSLREVPSFGSSIERATNSQALRSEYEVTVTETVALPDGTSKTVGLSGELPIRIFYGLWKDSKTGDFLLSGGAYPSTSRIELNGSVTGGRSKGIDATVDVDLGFDPSKIQEQIITAIKRIEPDRDGVNQRP